MVKAQRGGASAGAGVPQDRRVRVWDPPTRLFHWLLVALVAVNLYTGNVGGLGEMEWHMRSGYAILALVVFRLIWGFVGSHHSRFAEFVRGPWATARYLANFIRGPYRPFVGHNPLGGWSVVAILAALLLQAATGLFANDDILTEGPLADRVSTATSDTMTALHAINATVLYVLLAVHVAAIAIYFVVKKQNLIAAMVTGWKERGADRPGDDPAGAGTGTGDVADHAYASSFAAAVIAAMCAAAVWALVSV